MRDRTAEEHYQNRAYAKVKEDFSSLLMPMSSKVDKTDANCKASSLYPWLGLPPLAENINSS